MLLLTGCRSILYREDAEAQSRLPGAASEKAAVANHSSKTLCALGALAPLR